MVEPKPLKKPQVMVARAIVVPKDGNVPMRMLNMDHQPVTIYKGTKIALAEAVDNIREVCTVNEKERSTLTEQEQEEVLSNVLSTMPETLTDYELKQFCALISSFAHIFATKSDDLGRTSILKHKIETSGNPIRQAVRRLPLPKRDEVRKLLCEMQQKKIIAPSKSPWASPIILVPKKDGSVRFCVDYRKVNNVTHKDAYPIPRIDDTLDTLAGSKC